MKFVANALNNWFLLILSIISCNPTIIVLSPVHVKSLLSPTAEQCYLPGHNRVSSPKEPTVSRDESIVVALPSNILPADSKIRLMSR